MAIRLDISENQEQTALEIESEDAVRSVDISENQAQAPLRVGAKGLLRTITPDNGSPYYVGARAYVTQTADGATVTVIDKDGTTTADLSNGEDGEDGYSPSASVSKVGNTATITITDKDGTTTATVKDGSGQGLFIADYYVTTYADAKSAFEAEQNIICKMIDGNDTVLLPLIGFDGDDNVFYFCTEFAKEERWAILSQADGWDDWINSLAQVNADWNETQVDSPALILNKPTIPARNIWYGECTTNSSTGVKVVTTSSGDFTLATGNMIVVKFAHTNQQSAAYLKIDNATSTRIYQLDGTSDVSYRWGSGEVVMFAYDGTNFILLDQSIASTTAYGITKLNNTTSSTSTTEAATAKAVKLAYDNGGVQSVNGSTGAIVLPDYVEEQGTSGIWTYRKWNSGIAECWGKDTKSAAVSTAWGNGYLSANLDTSFPTDLFNAAPTGISFFVSGSYSASIVNTGTVPTKDAITYNLFRTSAVSTGQTYYIHITAIGTWK